MLLAENLENDSIWHVLTIQICQIFTMYGQNLLSDIVLRAYIFKLRLLTSVVAYYPVLRK